MIGNEKLFDIKNQVAIITGGAGFLGREHSDILAYSGCHAVIADIKENEAVELAKELTDKYKVECLGVGVDLQSKESVDAMTAKVVEKFGRIDILINNAQAFSKNSFPKVEDCPKEDWDLEMDVNIGGMFLCCQSVGKQMLKQKRGVIVNVCSTHGLVSPDFRNYEGTDLGSPIAYTASKSAVVGFTKYLATYWGGKGIRVNTLTPAGVFNNQPEDFVKKYSEKFPLERMMRKDELKGPLLFLASDASSFVNGANLVVDGGFTAL